MKKIDLNSHKIWITLYLVYLAYILIIQLFIIPHIPSLHAGNGILKGDNELFYKWAIDMSNTIKENGLSSWQLFPDNAAGLNVSLPALVFSFFGNNISYIAPWSALLHVLSAYALFRFLLNLNFSSKSTIPGILFFIFLPTSIIWTTQLLKDLYSNFGWMLMLFALSSIDKNIKKSHLFLTSALSVALIMSVRPMYLNLMLLLLIIFFIVSIFNTKLKSFNKTRVILFLIPVFLGFAYFYIWGIKNTNNDDHFISSTSTTTSTFISNCNFNNWTQSKLIPDFLDRKFQTLAYLRKRQICYTPRESKSNFSTSFFPESTFDFLSHSPKLLLDSLIQPTPISLLKLKSVSAYLVLIEMIVFYLALLFLIGLIYYKKIDQTLFSYLTPFIVALLIFTVSTPNLGTLHRVRYTFFILLISISTSSYGMLKLKTKSLT